MATGWRCYRYQPGCSTSSKWVTNFPQSDTHTNVEEILDQLDEPDFRGT